MQINNQQIKSVTAIGISGGATTWQTNGSGHLLPAADNTYDIGSLTATARSLYSQLASIGSVAISTPGADSLIYGQSTGLQLYSTNTTWMESFTGANTVKCNGDGTISATAATANKDIKLSAGGQGLITAVLGTGRVHASPGFTASNAAALDAITTYLDAPSSDTASLGSYTYSNVNVRQTNWTGSRARGSIGTEADVINGDPLLYIKAQGWASSAFREAARIRFVVDGSPASGFVPTTISFDTTDNSNSVFERAQIKTAGLALSNSSRLLYNTGGTYSSSAPEIVGPSDQNMFITAGSTGSLGRSITLYGGDATTGASNTAGSVTIRGGNSTNTTSGGSGGSITIISGSSNTGNSGFISISTPNANNYVGSSFNAGSFSVTTGNSAANGTGSVSGPNITFTCGNGQNSIGATVHGGHFIVTAGTGSGGGSNPFGSVAGGDIQLTAGAGYQTATGGAVTITAGAGGSVSGTGGSVTIAAGTPVDGNGGGITLTAKAGVGTDRSGGAILLQAGGGLGAGSGGNVTINAGQLASPSTGAPGNIAISAGGVVSGTANGGTVTISGGIGNGTGAGGLTRIRGGQSLGATGGDIELLGGAGVNGGNVIATGGDASGTDQNAGGVTISTGLSTGAGYADLKLRTCFSDGSSSTSQAIYDRIYVSGKRFTLSDNVTTTFATVAVPTGEMISGTCWYSGRSSDGTDFQSVRGSFNFAAVNKAGTLTSNASAAQASTHANSSGASLIDTPSVSNGASLINLEMKLDTTLAAPTILDVAYTIMLDSPSMITPQ
jgi:hypothetical protein